MKALIDGDILCYEIGFSAQKKNPETGEIEISSWDFVEELLQRKIDIICDEARADSYQLFLTNTEWLNERMNRANRFWDDPKPFIPNFRIAAALDGQEKAYKGQRVAAKPFHYQNLLAHLQGVYGAVVSREGLEADDLMCIEQMQALKEGRDTIICSRDKDLRQCLGWCYSWEMGKQPSFGPHFVEGVGFLEPKYKGKTLDKVIGVGPKFFYYQMVVGDGVDNIAGLYGYGPAYGYRLLKDAASERECYELVAELYKKEHQENWKEKMTTQASLLFLIKEMKNGKPIGWRPPAK